MARSRSRETSSLPPPSASADHRPLHHLGVLIVVVALGGFGTWAALAPLSSAAHAPGVVTVESYRKTIQHLEGGIVKEIAVRDGQFVEKDQPLITLEDTQTRAQLEVFRGQYFIALAREARLAAQRDGLGTIAYPPELAGHRTDERVREAMRVQTQIFQTRMSAQEGEVQLYRQQTKQLRAKATGVRAQQSSHQKLVESFRSELEDFHALLKEGYAEKQKVREFERNLANAEGQLGEYVSSLAEIDQQVSEIQLKILQLQKDLQREVVRELFETQVQLFELREKIQSAHDTVARTVIRAPQSGTVHDLQVHTSGAVIRSGVKLLDIVPDGERLIAEARVSPIDIDRVRIGQTAEVRFTAFRLRDTPRVEGRLIALSADRLVEESDRARTPYYLARVEIEPEGLKALASQDLKLLPGMPVEVLINTGERTLVQYLLDPLKNTFARSLIED